MKTTEFIVETSLIAQEADVMHQDHEVQMARADCYNAAKYAIDLHRMLKQISEQQGLEGWVSEKITLANDYLRTVHEYLMHEIAHGEQEMMGFTAEAAEYAFNQLLVEDDYDDAVKDFFARGGKVEKLSAKKPRKSEKTDFSSRHIGGRGEVGKGKAGRIGKSAKTDPEGKPVVTAEGKQISEMTAGASGSGSVAISMGGPGHKPTSGVPKKLGNAHKSKKVTVGKGVY